MNREIGINIYTRLCINQITKENVLHSTRNSTPCRGHPGAASGKEPACQCRKPKRHRFDSWLGKIRWRRAWQPTPVILPGESPWTEEPGGLQFMGL